MSVKLYCLKVLKELICFLKFVLYFAAGETNGIEESVFGLH